MLWFQCCEALLFKQPQKTSLISDWMRHILVNHASYLLGHPVLKRKLHLIYQTLQDRLQSHSALLRVQGKLDLLISTGRDRLELLKEIEEREKENVEPIRHFQENETVEEITTIEDQSDDTNTKIGSDQESDLDDDDLAALMEDGDFDEDLLGELL